MNNPSLQEENLRLKRAVDELVFLNELSQAIGSSFNSQEIMQTIIGKVIRELNMEKNHIIMASWMPF